MRGSEKMPETVAKMLKLANNFPPNEKAFIYASCQLRLEIENKASRQQGQSNV